MIRPHAKLGGRTPAEIAGQRGWGVRPTPLPFHQPVPNTGFTPPGEAIAAGRSQPDPFTLLRAQ